MGLKKRPDYVFYDLTILVVNINGSQFLIQNQKLHASKLQIQPVQQKFMNRSRLLKPRVFPTSLGRFYISITFTHGFQHQKPLALRIKHLWGHDGTGGDETRGGKKLKPGFKPTNFLGKRRSFPFFWRKDDKRRVFFFSDFFWLGQEKKMGCIFFGSE